VRTACVDFLKEVLTRNPFGASFDLEYWQAEVDAAQKVRLDMKLKLSSSGSTKPDSSWKT